MSSPRMAVLARQGGVAATGRSGRLPVARVLRMLQEAGNTAALALLIGKGAVLDAVCMQRRWATCGFSPLMIAAKHGQVGANPLLLPRSI
jgi:hypothetical protein